MIQAKNIKPLKFLSEEQIETIHKETLNILEHTGVKVYSNTLLKKLKNCGIRIDNDIVFFSKRNFDDALKTRKKEFSIYGLGDEQKVVFGTDAKIIGCSAGAVQYFDFQTMKLRDSTFEDLVNFTRVVESSDLIDRAAPGCIVKDAEENKQMLLTAKGFMLNTSKPIELAPHNVYELNTYLELNEIVSGYNNIKHKPRFEVVISTTSPLQLDSDSAENLMYSIDKGLPIHSAAAPMAGATGPYTLAGTTLLNNIESMFLFICTQILNPGHGFIRGGALCIMDMRKMTVYDSAERALLVGANSDLANWYGLPSVAPSGYVISWDIDAQQAFQKMFGYLTRVLSKGNLLISVGSLNSGLGISCEQIIIDLEMIKMTSRLLKGINFADDALATEVIRKVSHGGNFLTDDHTIKWMQMKEEHEYLELINIEGPSGRTMLEKAHDKVEKMLSHYKPIFENKIIQEVDRYCTYKL